MSEAIIPTAEGSRLNEVIDEVTSLLQKNGDINPDSLSQESIDVLSEKGIDLEVLKVMALTDTANVLNLTTSGGFRQETVIRTVQMLTNLGLITRGKMGEKAKLEMPTNKELARTKLIINERAKRSKNNQRINLLHQNTPEIAEDVLKLYSSYESLKSRQENEIKDIKILKNNYHSYSVLFYNIQNEIEIASGLIDDSNQEKKDKLKAHLEAIKTLIQEEQRKIFDKIKEIIGNEIKKTTDHIKIGYKDWDFDDLDAESHELHTRLDHLLGRPLDNEDMIFSPFEEYIIGKIFELKIRISAVEELLKKPKDATGSIVPDNITESQTSDGESSSGETSEDHAEKKKTEEAREPVHEELSEDELRIRNMRRILKKPKSIKDLVSEAMQEPLAPPTQTLTPEQKLKEQKEKEEFSKVSRRKFLGLATAGTGVIALSAASLIAHKKLNPDVGLNTDFNGIDTSSLEPAKEGSTETYKGVKLTIKKPEYGPNNMPELQKELMNKPGAIYDRNTGNAIYGPNSRYLMEEPLVEFEHTIVENGKNTKGKLLLKRSTAKALIDAQEKLGKPIPIREGLRRNQTQKKWYERNNCKGEYASKNCSPRPYPTAEPGSSNHEIGQAIDINVSRKERPKVKEALLAFGFLDHAPNDPPHFGFRGDKAWTATDRENSKGNDNPSVINKFERWFRRSTSGKWGRKAGELFNRAVRGASRFFK